MKYNLYQEHQIFGVRKMHQMFENFIRTYNIKEKYIDEDNLSIPAPTSATVPPPHVMTTLAIHTDANVQTRSVFAKTMSVSGRVFSN